MKCTKTKNTMLYKIKRPSNLEVIVLLIIVQLAQRVIVNGDAKWTTHHKGLRATNKTITIKAHVQQPAQPGSSETDGQVEGFHDCGLAPMNWRTMTKRSRETRNKTVSPYIINGHRSSYGEWPSFAIIERLGKPWCNGVLISDDLVLTAGHCFYEEGLLINHDQFDILLGKHSIARHADKHEQHIGALATCLSPEMPPLDNKLKHHDFGLVMLKKRAKLNKHVQPACLPDETTEIDYTTCQVVGAGAVAMIGLFGISPRVVQTMQVKRVNCSHEWSQLDSGMFCWTKTRGEGDTCVGDSGGPILCLDKRMQRWFVVGITSHGTKTCNGSGPQGWVAVYSNVAALRPALKTHCNI